MRVAGFLPLTLSDFPGRVAAMVFTPGCNFRCPFCHNSDLLESIGANAFMEVFAYLQQRRHLLDGVVFSGGEPTLQTELPESLVRSRDLGLLTKLDTNGSHPQVLADLFRQHLVDYVAMDVKAPWDSYDRLAGRPVDIQALKESVALIATSGVEHQFRTTWVPDLLTEADLQRIKAQLPAHSPHCVQRVAAEHTLDPSLRRTG